MNVLDYEKIIEQTAVYPKEVGLLYCALGLSGESGEVAEKVKKLVRDTDYLKDKELSPQFLDSLEKELGDVLWYITAIGAEVGIPLSKIMLTNYEKLIKRKEDSTLHGSGDNR